MSYEKVTEGPHTAEFMLSEADGYRSREKITIEEEADSEIRKPGTVLGKKYASTIGAPAAGGGNTGNGTVTAVTAGSKVQPGTYTLRCIAAAADSGTFEVITPDGQQLPVDATVAVAYTSDHLNLTINDGGTDFAVGDSFTIAVSGSNKYVPLDQAAVDGSHVAAAVLYGEADSSLDDAPATGIVRDAELAGAMLIWPDGADVDLGKQQLATLGVIVR